MTLVLSSSSSSRNVLVLRFGASCTLVSSSALCALHSDHPHVWRTTTSSGTRLGRPSWPHPRSRWQTPCGARCRRPFGGSVGCGPRPLGCRCAATGCGMRSAVARHGRLTPERPWHLHQFADALRGSRRERTRQSLACHEWLLPPPMLAHKARTARATGSRSAPQATRGVSVYNVYIAGASRTTLRPSVLRYQEAYIGLPDLAHTRGREPHRSDTPPRRGECGVMRQRLRGRALLRAPGHH